MSDQPTPSAAGSIVLRGAIAGTIRRVERVDARTLTVVVEKDGHTYCNVMHPEMGPHVRLSPAAFDDLERQLRQLIRP